MSKKENFTKSVSVVIFYSLISKSLGFIREALMASRFGVGYEADTYIVAIAATTFIANMISNSLSSIMIPVCIDIEKEHGKQGKDRYFSNVINTGFITGLLLIFLSNVFSPYIIKVFAHGFDGEQFKLAVEVNRIALPAILGIILSAAFIGYLHSESRFTTTSLIGISLNLTLIVYLFIIGNKFGIKGLAVATVIAYLSQVSIMIPETIKSKYNYTFYLNLKDKDLIRTLKLSLPVMIASSAQQINIIVDKTMASTLSEGSISSLNYAAITSTIFFEVFVVSIITVVFPVISKAFSDKDMCKLNVVIIKGFRLILLITIPASVGMIILATPIIKVLFERGAFDNNATEITVQAFALYSIAMSFLGVKRLAQRVYYSYGNTQKPMINGIIEVVVNISLNMILARYLGHRGLALSTSLAVILTSFLFLRGIIKLIGGINKKNSVIFIGKVILSSSIMGAIIVLISNLINIEIGYGFIYNFFYLLFMIIVGILIYFVVCKFLGIEEIASISIDKIKKIYRSQTH